MSRPTDRIPLSGRCLGLVSLVALCGGLWLWRTTEANEANSWHGVAIKTYEHLDGMGGGRLLKGEWSDPFSSSNNRLCELLSAGTVPDTTGGSADHRCPSQCVNTTARVSRRRVRKSIGKMGEGEWQRVVEAMWEMKTLSDSEGQAKYGAGFRSMDYINVRHVAATIPNQRLNATSGSYERDIDVTGGGAQTYMWHGLFTLEVESALLAIDPTIPGLPYLDWGHDFEVLTRRLGAADLELPFYTEHDAWPGATSPFADACIDPGDNTKYCVLAGLADGDFANWPVGQFDVGGWWQQQTAFARERFRTLYESGQMQRYTNISRGQLRVAPTGKSMYDTGNLAEADGTIPYVLRFKNGWDASYGTETAQTSWNAAVATCLGVKGLYQDLSECLEGRMAVNQFELHFNAHFIGGDMKEATIPHDPLFFFHHAGLDRLRQQWAHANTDIRPMAFGYPIESMGYTTAMGTKVGLYDCLGCTSYDAGFTAADVLGTSDGELNALPLSSGWLTPADYLCVLDGVFTYDVIVDAEEAAADAVALASAWASAPAAPVSLVLMPLLLISAALATRFAYSLGTRARSRAQGRWTEEKGSLAALDRAPRDDHVGYDLGENDAAATAAAASPGQSGAVLDACRGGGHPCRGYFV